MKEYDNTMPKKVVEKSNSDPKDYCPGCNVLICWKEDDGFYAMKKEAHPIKFKCIRQKRVTRAKYDIGDSR